MSVPSSPPAHRLDTSALTQPVADQALQPFIAESKRTSKPWIRVTTGKPRRGFGDIFSLFLPILVPVAGFTVLGFMAGTDMLAALWELLWQAPFPTPQLVLLAIAVFLVIATSRALLVIRSLRVPRSWWEAAYRLTRFADDNGLRYGHDETDSLPGVIFTAGFDQTFERRLTTTAGRRIEIGNYRYLTQDSSSDSNHDPTIHGWGYVAITLDRRLPHMLLDAKSNDKRALGLRMSNLPVDLDPDQKLALGGEFDESFTLYAPGNYGRDAFYIFAPDLMALFIDRLGTYDVEIIDDRMYLYGDRFDLLDPGTYAWLTELVQTVVARTVRRTERYSDDFAALACDPSTQPDPAENSDPSGGAAPAHAALPGAAFLQPVPGLPVVPEQAGAPTDTPAPPGSAAFSFDADAKAASNVVAEGGRRLKRRPVRLVTVAVLVLLVLYYIYDGFIAPTLGLPRR